MAEQVDPINEAMNRWAAGEDSAFDRLYALIAPRLYGFCVRLVASRGEADDLLQETFLKLHRSRATYVAGATALHWAFAITRSVHLDRLRYKKRRPEDLTETGVDAETFSSGSSGNGHGAMASELGNPESEAQARELMLVVEKVLAGLPESQRAAFVLLKEEGLSVAEAAAILGTTAMAVKLRAHRAYEALRAALREAGADAERQPPHPTHPTHPGDGRGPQGRR